MVNVFTSKPILPVKFNSATTVFASVQVLKTRPGEIVREKNKEPWECELLLIEKPNYGYYIIKLPAQGYSRSLGQTTINAAWIDPKQHYNTLQEAMDAFGPNDNLGD